MVPRVGVASSIAEGFLVLPFARRDEQHTGHHPSVPPTLLATGLLHDDGSAPDVAALQEADFGAGDEYGRRLPEQMRVRLSKLKALQDSGIDAYPVGQPPSHTVAQALEAGDETDVSVSGRVLRIRDFGGVLFAQLRDWSAEVQLLLENSILENSRTADFTKAIDLGDLVEVTGHMGYSKTGTQSLIVRRWRLIGKCLRPLPNKWKGPTPKRACAVAMSTWL
jgi:lysyl-tRNA synthetase class 2